MSGEDPRVLFTKVEAAHTEGMLIAWYRDPESSPEYVRRLEEVIDLRRKMWP
jgi:hypothetical protein